MCGSRAGWETVKNALICRWWRVASSSTGAQLMLLLNVE